MQEKLLGSQPVGLAFIVSAPAGTGKTTLVKMLMKEFPCVVGSISYTTRMPRAGEVDGKDYHFISNEEFKRRIEENEFLEYVKLYGCYYGTSRLAVEELLAQGKHVILVIDTQGSIQLREKFPATFIFLQPPSLEILRERLSLRKTESLLGIEERLAWAQKEFEAVVYYDYRIINDDLAVAYQILKSILIAEDHRVRFKRS